MRRVAIIGANGQLGTDLQPALQGFDVVTFRRADFDVRDTDRLTAALVDVKPDVVINTSAFHKVDLCEDEPQASFEVNAIAPYRLALLAERLGFTLVHFSTDYVFDGTKTTPYREDDLPRPLSVYAASKLAGEILVRNFCRRHFVIRTTGLYGRAGSRGKGGNFVETMLRLARAGQSLRVVEDQVLSPTATAHLAPAVAALLEREAAGKIEHGLYHVTAAGKCSWFEFARTIFEISGVAADLTPIKSADAPYKARRPAYSVLAHDKWVAAGLPELPHWRDGLRQYLSA